MHKYKQVQACISWLLLCICVVWFYVNLCLHACVRLNCVPEAQYGPQSQFLPCHVFYYGCLDYLDLSYIHFQRPAVFPSSICFTNGHTSAHTHTHIHTPLMDVRKKCLVFSPRPEGKATERRILNHLYASGGKHIPADIHPPQTHTLMHMVWGD